jgi:hypothetical protein
MLVLYKGAKGKGKTLTMLKDGLAYMNDGYKVYRNFDCAYGKYISNEEILKLDKDSPYEYCVIMIDELQIFFDARRSSKHQNLNFSNFIQQIRKRHIIILATTQYSSTVDLRFRQNCDYVVYPNYIQELKLCEAVYVDISPLDDPFNPATELKKVKIVFDPEPLFKMYNTDQMIR